jgi:hypothetical protein
VALNMNAMVGIGPFIVIPLVIQAMGGSKRSAGAKSTARIVTVAAVRMIPSFSMSFVCSAKILHHFVIP